MNYFLFSFLNKPTAEFIKLCLLWLEFLGV